MIDEKKLLEVIEEYAYPITQFNNSIDIGMTLQGVKQAIDEQPKISEWIPCSAWLPNDPEGGIPRDRDELEDAYVKDRIKEYIVMIEGASIPTALFYGGEGRWYDCNGTQELYRVVAWQPLPEQYRGDEE